MSGASMLPANKTTRMAVVLALKQTRDTANTSVYLLLTSIIPGRPIELTIDSMHLGTVSGDHAVRSLHGRSDQLLESGTVHETVARLCKPVLLRARNIFRRLG